MKGNYIKNYKNSHNLFNLVNSKQKINTDNINGNYSSMIIEPDNLIKNRKKLIPKKKSINFNLSQIDKSKKNLKNNDMDNDIYNTIPTSYYTQKTNKVKKCIKIPNSETTKSRNFNRLNSDYFGNTIINSFSISNDIIKYDNNKIKYDLDKLRENGIKYCFDENGNPMDILDIKIKNKNPIAFIIHTANKNLLMDTNNKIIYPNKTGDYTLSHIPYIIIHKYDLLHPELRIIKSDNQDNSLNKNDKIINFKNSNRVNNNISSFLNDYDLKNLNGLNEIDENKEVKTDTFQFFSPIITPKIETFSKLNKNLKSHKRKYILVNRLNNFNKSIPSISEKDIKNNSLTKKNFQIKDNAINDKDFKQKEDFSLIKEEYSKNTSLFNNEQNNKLLLQDNPKLSDSKHLSQIKINNNLEFKFERKYKSNYSFINQEQSNKENQNKKIDTKLVDDFNSMPKNTDFKRTKKNLLLNSNPNTKLDMNKFKRKRFSNSFNEFMFNPLLKAKPIKKQVNNAFNYWNTLSTFNQSLINTNSENTNFSTNKKSYNESEKNNSLKKSSIKNSIKINYYLKPKIKFAKFCHKRINTENFNTEKNIKFLQTIENRNNSLTNNNNITPFSFTEVDFNTNKKFHDSTCSNNVCKCPYCNNLFYN